MASIRACPQLRLEFWLGSCSKLLVPDILRYLVHLWLIQWTLHAHESMDQEAQNHSFLDTWASLIRAIFCASSKASEYSIFFPHGRTTGIGLFKTILFCSQIFDFWRILLRHNRMLYTCHLHWPLCHVLLTAWIRTRRRNPWLWKAESSYWAHGSALPDILFMHILKINL
jgi:hypothetical protein